MNIAIVYSIWKYYLHTENFKFMLHYSREMIFEIARFWSSFIIYNFDSDRYGI
ncbi:hypothetical protein B1F79_02300 [Coxiella-like endosymbiont of Rhipicephalus sanguineus]|nr:hypothetical protein [Coxiella-like endosymbiont of Rhipicephalus sanguineus]